MTATALSIGGVPTSALQPFLKIFADASAALNAKFGNITADEAVFVDAVAIAAVLDPVLAPYAAILPAAFTGANVIGSWIISALKSPPARMPGSIFAPAPSHPLGAPRATGII